MSGQFLFVHNNEWADFETPDAIPISQGYILANLRKNGYSGQILGDYKNSPLSPQIFKTIIQKIKPHAVGFSGYEENMNRVRLWARFAKSINPDVTIVLGGPQATFMPGKALLQMKEVDVLCRGEGELVMLGIAHALTNKTPLSKVPGICVLKNGTPLETGTANRPEDLDELPSPYLNEDLDLIGKSRVILLSSRGCTSPCTFCYTTRASGKKVRFHSIDRIIDEMLFLKQRDKTDFWFADPNFAFSRKRLEALLEAIIRKVPGIRFWCQTRYNLIDRKLVGLLKRAGVHTIAFGLESADPDVLKRIKKGLDPGKMSRAIKLVKDADIEVELFTLFGLPGETMEQAGKTLDFVKQNRVAITGNSISQQLHLFFGTPISDDPAAHGITPLPRLRRAYQSICRDFRTDSMSEEEIRRMALIWRLNRQDFEEKITHGVDLFSISGFITRNRDVFSQRPEAAMMLARIYMQLDEFGAAASCMRRLHDNFSDSQEVRRFLSTPCVGYKSRRRGVARPGCKIIFDCRGAAPR